MAAHSTPPTPTVTVRSGRVAFEGAPLFDGLDVTLAGGRLTCLLGPSGIGKTTLLRLILGLETGTLNGGAVACSDGLPVAGRVAFMAQRDLLYPWLTVTQNVALGARLRGDTGRAEAHARACEFLALVGLGDVADDRPDTLSGGMRQRAALARTLMEDRPIVLMDEPFSGLDVATKLRLQNLAAELLAGRTVLLVTHDPYEALRLGHRIHVMSGRPARLDDPLTPPGPPPRAIDDPAVLALQGDLLKRLAEAAP